MSLVPLDEDWWDHSMEFISFRGSAYCQVERPTSREESAFGRLVMVGEIRGAGI